MSYNANRTPEDRSIGDLFKELGQEMSVLIRQEMDLFRVEMGQKASRVAKNAAFLAAGGFILYSGFLVLLAALVFALRQAGISWFGSALIVAALTLAAGAALVMKGLKALRATDPVPRETLHTLKT